MARSFNLGFLSGLLADAVLWGGVHTLLQYDPSLSQYIQFRQFGMDHRKAEKESFGGGCDVSKRAGRHGE